MEPQQPLDDRELGGLDVFARQERSVPVAVDRLEDRIAEPQVLQVGLEDVKVIAVGMERAQPQLGTLPAIKAVIVIGGHVRRLCLAEDAHQPAGERRLAGRRVTDDAEEDRSGHCLRVSQPDRRASPEKSSMAQRPQPMGAVGGGGNHSSESM